MKMDSRNSKGISKGISKGDWAPLAKAEDYRLWEVLTKEGATHEVVTLDILGEEIILEVDGEAW